MLVNEGLSARDREAADATDAAVEVMGFNSLFPCEGLAGLDGDGLIHR
jgi:hypothetical protein